ncbi:MAG: hypothetical protein JNJ77_04100 [Planctomycetia bacterium]|nr:hypothetical protein [Planctomycetia bacterium]
MEFEYGDVSLTLFDDPTYTQGSADNVHQYEHEYCFVTEYQPTSKHGLICKHVTGSTHSCILLAGSGATGVHKHSAVIVNGSCFIGVGDMLCSLSLPDLQLKWATKVDTVTCFGVYYYPQEECLLSHGECEIVRLSMSGDIVWTAGGRDIITEGFRIIGNQIEAIDFYQNVYRFKISTGREV